MTIVQSQAGNPGADAGAEGAGVPLPSIATQLDAAQIRERLLTASKRGRLPGYRGEPGLFSVSAHGHPFDGELLGELRDGRIEFRIRMLRKLPIIFAVVIVLTIWPGVYLTDQLIPGQWGWIPTWWWYLPVTIIPTPWMWRNLMGKSKRTMDGSAREGIQKIAAELGGGGGGATE